MTITPTRILSKAMWNYFHALEKHPYFADSFSAIGEQGRDNYSKSRLDHWRTTLACEKANGHVRALTLLQCEISEAIDEHENGETARAVEECYDAIAVLMRMIDVLEGRQSLGKPKEER